MALEISIKAISATKAMDFQKKTGFRGIFYHKYQTDKGEKAMSNMSSVKRPILTGVCAALCVVLPMAVHSIPNAGRILSPMHLPVLLCGLAAGWPYGLLCGLIGPLLSSMMTGMPAAAMLPSMMIELAVYGFLAGLLMKVIHTGKLYADLYISLICAMLGGRIAAAVVSAFIFAAGSFSIKAWAMSYFVTALPGIVLQLILVPVLTAALMRAGLIPGRYGKGNSKKS